MAKTKQIKLSIEGANELWRKTTKLFVGNPSSTADDSGRPVETTAVPPALEDYVKETPGGLVYTPEWYEKTHGADVSPWQGSIDVGDPEPLKIDADDVTWESAGPLTPSGVHVIDDLWVAKYIDPLNQPFLLAVGDELDLDPRDFDLGEAEFWGCFSALPTVDLGSLDWRIECPLTNQKIGVSDLLAMGKTPPSSLALRDRMARTSPSSSSAKATPSMGSLDMSEEETAAFAKEYLGKLTSSKARSNMDSEKNSIRFSRLKSTT